MALLIMMVRRMAKNKWLEFSLLLGLVISVGLASSMPIYTNAILQRMLIKDLELVQQTQQAYPGVLWYSAYLTGDVTPDQAVTHIRDTDTYMTETAQRELKLPVEAYLIERATDRFKLSPVDPARVDPSVSRNADIVALSSLEEHAVLKDGVWPRKEPVNGVYEVVVVEEALTSLKTVVGNEFIIDDPSAPNRLTFKIVGVIDRKSFDDVYWYNVMSIYKGSLLLPYEAFDKHFLQERKLLVRSSIWHTAVDYSRMTLDSVPRFIDVHHQTESLLAERFGYGVTTKTPMLSTLKGYFEKEEKLRLLLWSLNVPVMIMLGYYLYMVSNLITERRKTEIAVMRSRGASRTQIVVGFLLEGMLLGVIALVIGPFAGLLLTQILGSSNGFLEFVQRAALQVELSDEAFRYGSIAVLISVLTTILPVLFATRATIVNHKQQLSRGLKTSFWHKYYMDVILVGISLYGLQTFRRRMEDLQALGLEAGDLQIDPLLFLVPALFILGCAFLALRVYPLLVQLIYAMGKRWWPPSLYSVLLQVGRSATQYQAIMVFLSVTLATGMFGASAARTINNNAAERIYYMNGTDVTMKIKWEDDAPPPSAPGEGAQAAAESALSVGKKKIQYAEPPFLPLTQLPGVEHAAKVFQKKDAAFFAGKERGTAQLMGIDTDDFGKTAWLRDGLLEHHLYEYLNLLAQDPSAVLISKTMAEAYQLKPGDNVSAGWNGVEAANFTVYGIVEYWPSWNPNPQYGSKASLPAANNRTGKIQPPMLMVGHLSYIQNNLALEPYDVWLKMREDSSSQSLYQALEDKQIPVEQMNDARQMLISGKNDPFQLAINGVMTLGFLISILICFCGFLLYWILTLSSRVLQMGILQAMGNSFRQLLFMLTGEQLLTSGAAVTIGLFLGAAASRLYVPMFQLSLQSSAQVPPFQVILDPSDQLQLFLIVIMMLTLGLSILGTMLSRIKIHQAVKLGED